MKYAGRWIALMGLLLTFNAYAISEVEQQQQRIIQEQQQRQQFLQDEIKRQQQQHNPLEATTPPKASMPKSEHCFEIAQIELQGVTLLSESEQQTLLAPYLNQCLDLGKINQLLEAISQWYFDLGYITTRAYVAAQDLSDGKLVIIVVEGTLESLQLIDPNSHINLFTAFPLVSGDILNLRDIEQGLEQINRLQSKQVTMELLPGQTPGASQIHIQSQTSRPWMLSLSRDNSGQDSTGELMNSAFLGVDNLLGLNDYSYLQVQKDIETDGAGKANKGISWHWDMPMGYWNYGVDINYFEYLNTIRETTPNIESSGTSLTQKVFVSRLLHRDQNSKLQLNTSLARKKTENFIEDALLDSSRKLAIANMGLEYQLYLPEQRQWQFSLDYYRGLKAFGAPEDKHRAAGYPKAQFDKVTSRVNYQHYIRFKPTEQWVLPMQWQSALTLQWSDDVLFGSEQISIGSLYTVRGYKGSSISASNGGYWRNTLNFPFSTPSQGKLMQSITPYIAFDMGAIRDKANSYTGSRYASLKGWATGVQIIGQHYSVNLTYARPIHAPAWLGAEQEQWHFNVSVKF